MSRGDPRDLALVAQRLYERFLAPLVTGGDLTPGPAVGARRALLLDGGTAAVDPGIRSTVDLARVRVARRLVPVDVVPEPSGAVWALGSALHDMTHAFHPDMGAALHRSAPDTLLDFAVQVIERTPAADSLAELLSRHTFFARIFDMARTDTRVSWWTGSRTFLGTDPPSRLVAWPDLRRVHTDQHRVAFVELPGPAQARRQDAFRRVLGALLEKLPLTDLATSSRSAPAFRWTGASLGLFATPHGRVLGHRALSIGKTGEVDAALGRATRPYAQGQQGHDELLAIGEILAERALAAASTDTGAESLTGDPSSEQARDAHLARHLGASIAMKRLESTSASPSSLHRLRARLLPLAQSTEDRAAPAYFFASASLENAAGSVGGSSTSSDE